MVLQPCLATIEIDSDTVEVSEQLGGASCTMETGTTAWAADTGGGYL